MLKKKWLFSTGNLQLKFTFKQCEFHDSREFYSFDSLGLCSHLRTVPATQQELITNFIIAEDTMIMQHSKCSDRDVPGDFNITSLS